MTKSAFQWQGWILAAALTVCAGCTANEGPPDAEAQASAGTGASLAGTSGGVASASGSSAGRQAGSSGNTTTGTAGAASASGAAGAAGSSAVGPGPSAAGTGGVSGGSGAAAQSGGAGGPAAGSGGSSGALAVGLEHFSFFVTSYAAIQRLSGSVDGFGGDLRYGKADGLAGADQICTEIAETSMPGSGAKAWRAFLSVTKGPDGQPIHAKSRVGQGPWYDRVGRLVAMNLDDLMQARPRGADPAILNDLPNEDGVPNQAPDGMEVDNHDILTGTNTLGELFSDDPGFTCQDWTSAVGSDGTPRVGHSWPRMGGGGPGGGPPGGDFPGGGFPGGGPPPDLGEDFDPANWMSALTEAGCAPGASLVEMGPPDPEIPTVGSGGGYGGFYCFALMP